MMKIEFLENVYAGYQVMRHINFKHGVLIRCRFIERGAVVYYREASA